MTVQIYEPKLEKRVLRGKAMFTADEHAVFKILAGEIIKAQFLV